MALTDSLGNIVQEYSYDAWGRRRDPDSWDEADTRNNLIVERGYTGNEHLDHFGLINMNGRVYDALLGRFLSPDNYVQEPGNSQNFNRYAYCLNNPLSLMDPSGYSWLSDNWRTLLTAAIAITATVVTAGILAPAAGTVLSAATAGQFMTAAVVYGAVGGFAGASRGLCLAGRILARRLKRGL